LALWHAHNYLILVELVLPILRHYGTVTS